MALRTLSYSITLANLGVTLEFVTDVATGSDLSARRVRASFARDWIADGRPALYLTRANGAREPRTLVQRGRSWYTRAVSL